MSMENMLDRKQLIIKAIQSMSGKYGVYQIFDDWVDIMAMAFANQVEYSELREKHYLETINQYNKAEQEKFCEMMAWLVEWADVEMFDMLGYIYMHLELGNKRTGQFFTPYHICQMMAEMQEYKEEQITANEPTCGGGGNIIALAEAMKKQGVNYQKRLTAICQDIDVKAVNMAYVQCTLYGIPAICFQSNTLIDPNGHESVTGKMYTFEYVMRNYRLIGGA